MDIETAAAQTAEFSEEAAMRQATGIETNSRNDTAFTVAGTQDASASSRLKETEGKATELQTNPQASTNVVPDTEQTKAPAQVSSVDHGEAKDKAKVAKNDFTQRLTKNIYERIKPNYAFTDLLKDDFYMKQKPAGPTLAEIKARPTRKQMMHEPQSASRLGEHIFGQRMKNMMSGVRSDADPERNLKTTDRVPQHLLDELGGELGVESLGFDSLEDLLELPKDVIAKVYNGDLVFADNSNSNSNRVSGHR